MIADSRFPRTPRCLIATIGHILKVEQVTKGQGLWGNGATGVSRACPCVAEAPSEAEGEVEGSGIAVAGRDARRSTSKFQRFSTGTYFCG